MNLPCHNPDLVVATDGFWDSDASNGLRASSAIAAVEFYRRKREFQADDVIVATDLITDLLHYLHSVGEDPIRELEKAKSYFVAEVMTPLSDTVD
jgi:hypothetical protein